MHGIKELEKRNYSGIQFQGAARISAYTVYCHQPRPRVARGFASKILDHVFYSTFHRNLRNKKLFVSLFGNCLLLFSRPKTLVDLLATHLPHGQQSRAR